MRTRVNIHNPKKKTKANNQQMFCNGSLPSTFIWMNILKTDWIFWVSLLLLLLFLSLKKNLYIKIKNVNPSVKSTRQMRAQVDTTKRKNESKQSTNFIKKKVLEIRAIFTAWQSSTWLQKPPEGRDRCTIGAIGRTCCWGSVISGLMRHEMKGS
jgi:hypothetical protein